MSDKEIFKVSGWNHILIEGYCMVNMEYFRKCSKWLSTFDINKDIDDWEKTPNPDYDPNIKPNEKPSWCSGHVGISCLESDKPHKACPYLAHCEVEDDLKERFQEAVREIYNLRED